MLRHFTLCSLARILHVYDEIIDSLELLTNPYSHQQISVSLTLRILIIEYHDNID